MCLLFVNNAQSLTVIYSSFADSRDRDAIFIFMTRLRLYYFVWTKNIRNCIL